MSVCHEAVCRAGAGCLASNSFAGGSRFAPDPQSIVGLALLAGWPLGAQAQAPACTGTNLLDELQSTDAGAHARVMAAAAATENARLDLLARG